MREIADPSQVTEELYLECMRAPGQPLIVRGGAAHWPAAKLWTFDYFAKNYADAPLVTLTDCLVRPTQRLEVPLVEYLEYVQRPQGTRLQALADQFKLKAPFYAYGSKPFLIYPELTAHYQLPPYAYDWCSHLPQEMRESIYPFGQPWLLFSGVGARSVLHRDGGSTIAWFAQLKGHKLFIVHPYEEKPLVYDGKVDPTQPDLELYPDYARARPVRFTLHEGDLMFLPQDWYHYVRTESPSITLTGNLVNHLNFGEYLQYAYKESLPQFLSSLRSPARFKASV